MAGARFHVGQHESALTVRRCWLDFTSL